ncbi:hypothetical protein GWK47_038963 [Chionoecetes opilio]|uniref:CCHC-type domain-containing protein n=1 Tax=Chionoecetes opilio TaxID=41210 RepID=A0A8J4YKJ1_CHIOP|nr:hypothetical protein GWK47_038963 [Chionoecetes opilio]
MFEDNLSIDVKLRWLAEVNRAFHLERDLAEVKMSAVNSRFVYISRDRLDVVGSAVNGDFLALTLTPQDSPDRTRKLPTYLVTRYPVGVDPSLSKELDDVYSARRFHQDGKPISRIVVTWTDTDPTPSSFAFSFLPSLPPCEFRLLHNDKPSCFKCWGIGHISRYCSGLERCAWCAGGYDSRTCPHRAPPPPPPVTGAHTPPPPPVDTSHWRCPRCQEPGVSVWHGCARRKAAVPSTPAPPPPPPLPHAATPLVPPASPSPQVQALRIAVDKLMTRCASLESRLDAIDARLTSVATSQANT